MRTDLLYSSSEQIVQDDYVTATYYLELPSTVDPYEKAKNMAVGQTVGTWLPVPGITDDMRKKHMGRIISILDLDPADLETQGEGLSSGGDCSLSAYLFKIAYPIINFDDRLPLMITTLLGNDASTSVRAKLLELFIPKSLADMYPGPAFGIEGLRELTGIKDRPLLLNMIKPCIGFSPDEGADIFYRTALGGVDFIKDDELLGNPSFCPLEERVRAYNRASDAAFERTGKRTLYVPNITDHIGNLLDNVKRAEEAGARMLMVNFASVGWGALQMVRKAAHVPILGHYAGAGPYYEGDHSGISSDLALGKLPRMTGADIVMINTPYGGYPVKRSKYLKTAGMLRLPFYDMKPSLPSLGGGVNPGMVHQLMTDLGNDIMLAPGGAIQGHPMGPASGIRAMYAAIDAKMHEIPLEEAVKDCEELKAAEYMWKH